METRRNGRDYRYVWRVAALSLLLGFGSAAYAQAPNDVIKEASDLLAAQLGARKEELASDREALYEMVNEIILPRFDRRYAAQLVLGRNWRSASEEQRAAFIDAFYQSLLQKYADGVLDFNQDRIELLPFRGDESKPRVVVKSLVTLNDGTEVPVDYGLVKREAGWMVFDVIIEGISYIRNFRTEVNSEIQTSSLDAVIARLEREAQENRDAE
jgi:phospholipid transport system substrate-binding protein